MVDGARGLGWDSVVPRAARAVIAGCAHHVTQRGNNRQNVFFVGEDADERRTEVQDLLSWSESYRVEIGKDAVRLTFVDATEDAHEDEEGPAPRTLRELLATGEIVSILE